MPASGSSGRPYSRETLRIVSASSRRPRGGSASAMFSATVSASNSEKVLEHHADAELSRLGRAADRHRLALPEDAPLVRRERAVEHLDQRRLAGAVLAEQRVHLAVADIEADVIAGRERAESLGQPLRLEQRNGAVLGPPWR